LYAINYSNTGTSDATGVIITESIPDYTKLLPERSTLSWVCDEDATTSGTACTFEIDRVAKGTVGRLALSFVVLVDRFIPEDVMVISNVVQISDDGIRGTPPTAAQLIEVTTPVLRPTSIELIYEPVFNPPMFNLPMFNPPMFNPPMFDSQPNTLFIPMVMMR